MEENENFIHNKYGCCSYCGKESNKLIKVGPKLRYCNRICYAKDCLKKYPDTPLADVIAKMYPEAVNK